MENKINEIWKDIDGYNGLYQVSNLGRVKSLKLGKERFLKAGKNGSGYLQIILCKEGKLKTCRVHRLVATAFVDNTEKLPCVNHKDENKTNNCADNLEWCTFQYNLSYGNRGKNISKKLKGKRLGEDKSCKTIRCIETGLIYTSSLDAQAKTGLRQQNILACCNGKLKTTGGLHFEFSKK